MKGKPTPVTELVIEHSPGQSPGAVSLVVRLGDTVLHADELNITSAVERQRFVEQLCASRPGVDREAVETELLSIVGHVSRKPDAPKRNQATELVGLAADIELFHTPGGCDSEAYATFRVGDHCETWPINAKGFRQWLSRQFYGKKGKVPSSQALQDAMTLLAGEAIHGGPEYPVAVRIAEHHGAIWLDLANAGWQAVQVTAHGWRVTADPPVRFVRKRGMLPLPIPVTGGSIDEFRSLVNLPDDGMWTLFVAWLAACVRPRGPYPILVVGGEQGSAKSSLCRFGRAIVDPNVAPLRRPPKDDRDLMIAATNGWVIAYDNLSGVPTSLSDVLCALATGGSFGVRALYSDGDEKLFDAMRPIMLNGIDDLVTRPDLLDRSLVLTLPVIPDQRRRDEAELWPAFTEAQPRILGALLDAVSAARRNLPEVKLTCRPRMADFATWVTAAEPALGWAPGTFLAAYTENREGANALALESSPLWPAVCGLMNTRGQWAGTAAELLAELEDRHADERTRKRRDWPKTPRGVSAALRRLAPNLRATGIDVRFEREPGGKRRRLLRLECLRIPSSQPSRQSRNPPGATETPIPAGRCRDGGGDQGPDNRPGESPVSAQPGPIRDGRDGRDGPILTHSGCGENDEWVEL